MGCARTLVETLPNFSVVSTVWGAGWITATLGCIYGQRRWAAPCLQVASSCNRYTALFPESWDPVAPSNPERHRTSILPINLIPDLSCSCANTIQTVSNKHVTFLSQGKVEALIPSKRRTRGTNVQCLSVKARSTSLAPRIQHRGSGGLPRVEMLCTSMTEDAKLWLAPSWAFVSASVLLEASHAQSSHLNCPIQPISMSRSLVSKREGSSHCFENLINTNTSLVIHTNRYIHYALRDPS